QAVQLLPGSFRKGSPKEWVEFVAETGLARTAIYPNRALTFGYITDPEWAVAACRAWNNWFADTYMAFDPVFIGMGILPLVEPERGAEELERIVTELGMKGGILPGNGLPLPLGSRYYAPVYEAADRLGCALSIHGGQANRLGLDHMSVY